MPRSRVRDAEAGARLPRSAKEVRKIKGAPTQTPAQRIHLRVRCVVKGHAWRREQAVDRDRELFCLTLREQEADAARRAMG